MVRKKECCGVIVPGPTVSIVRELIEIEGLSIESIARGSFNSIRSIIEIYQGRLASQNEDTKLVCFYAVLKMQKRTNSLSRIKSTILN